ncbi:hypothetical protein [Caulobacter endophyticus]|uniref:Uncharacterized protein n=1 Tax=Caulobacter endophyticus TaxID=2172652 RepID=A0A2T9JMK5_9CAUL|nr:hypothetical protein [Caulobacter endophyticus]PVM84913.1 hypothetical protein DDF67_18635 [Caulobacter endophyticus]
MRISAAPAEPDDTRLSAGAALLALLGHAGLAALLLARWPAQTPSDLTAHSVQVTLVQGGQAGPKGEAATPSRPFERLHASTQQPPSPPPSTDETGRRLDELLQSRPTPARQAARNETSATPAASTAPAAGEGRGGSSGLKAGEGLAGIDVFGGAALPVVGQRPAAPSGDLWKRVAPCWRSPGKLQVSLMVELGMAGDVVRLQTIRREGQAVDGQRLAAERSAARAIEACAPYAGLGAGRERLEFRP